MADEQVTEPPKKLKLLEVMSSKKARSRIEPLIAPGDTYERIMQVVDRVGRKNPEIEECTPGSVVDAAATIIGWNLEIGETAHIVPYNVKVSKRGEADRWEKRAQPQMDYKGMAQILVASKVVRAIEPWAVYENDYFEIIGGTAAEIIHKPVWKGVRGRMVGAYIIFRLPNQYSTFRYMTVEEIDAIRENHSKKWWKDFKGNVIPLPPWYAFKTVLRQAQKFLATTPALARAFAAFAQDEDIEYGLINAGEALPSGDTRDIGSPAEVRSITSGPAEPIKIELGETAAVLRSQAADKGGPADKALNVKIGEEPELDFQDDRDLVE